MSIIISMSTDIAGIFSRPDRLFEVYLPTKQLFEKHRIDWGFEVVGWKHNISRILRLIKINGYTTNGIHGRIGVIYKDRTTTTVDIAKVRSIDFLLLCPTPKFLDLSKHVADGSYILVHESELNRSGIESFFLKNKLVLPTLMIENNYSVNSLNNTLIKVDWLNSNGMDVGIMIDLLHLTKELSGVEKFTSDNWPKIWSVVMEKILYAIDRAETIGFHIPIGTTNDSLPVDLITLEQWKEMGKIVKKYRKKIRYMTMENQQNESILYLKNRDVSTLANRTLLTVKKLIDTGVIC